MSVPSDYGERRFLILVDKSTSKDGEIYAYADVVTVMGGALCLHGKHRQAEEDDYGESLVIAPGKWAAALSCSVADGSPVMVEHWPGIVNAEAIMRAYEHKAKRQEKMALPPWWKSLGDGKYRPRSLNDIMSGGDDEEAP